jgi:hypothetical protein
VQETFHTFGTAVAVATTFFAAHGVPMVELPTTCLSPVLTVQAMVEAAQRVPGFACCCASNTMVGQAWAGRDLDARGALLQHEVFIGEGTPGQ